MELELTCPYCGEAISIWVDEGGGDEQRYTEDCSVCCRPIEISVGRVDEGEDSEALGLRVSAQRADE